MILKNISELKIFLLIVLSFNIFFFNSIYFFNNILYSGKDSIRLHYSSKIELSEGLKSGAIPIWTDKLNGGYPIFFDLERGFQNIFNIISIFLLGPYESFDLQFFVSFIIGAISLYFYLKNNYSLSLINQLLFHLLYFYSFFILLHLQHQNFIFVLYLFPTLIHLTEKFIQNRNIIYTIFISIIYYFLITFGSLQMVFLAVLGNSIYIFLKSLGWRKIFGNMFYIFLPTILLSSTSIYFFYQLFLISERGQQDLPRQGNFNLQYLSAFIFPFILGNDNYLGFTLSSELFKHEFITYFSTSAVIIGLFVISNSIKSFAKSFFLIVLTSFLILNFFNFPPFDIFRYWARMAFLINFSLILLLAEYFSSQKSYLINKNFYILSISLLILVLSNFLDKDFRYIFIRALDETYLSLIILFIIVLSTFIFLKVKPKFLIFIIFLEFIYFNYQNNFHLFVNKIRIEELRIQPNKYQDTNDDYSLLKKGPSLSIYSQTIPVEINLLNNSRISSFFSMYNFLKHLFFSLILYFVCIYIFNKLFYVYKK